MKIVTLYTPSHEKMLNEYFLKYFPKNDKYDLKIIKSDETAGDNPVFNSPEWTKFMYVKAKVLQDELLSIPENEVYGFIDVDVITVNDFYYYVIENIKDLDFIAQSDSPNPSFLNVCTGVIFFKNTENTRNLLKAVNVYLDKFKNEQEAITHFAGNHQRFEELINLKFCLFPFSRAYTYGSIAGRVWRNDDYDFVLPDKNNLLWVHANYAEHNEKIPLLKLFEKKLGYESI